MPQRGPYSLPKAERICSRKVAEALFTKGAAKAMSAFPVRAVYMLRQRETDEPPVQIMVSVPKRYFKRAVKRNRVKRQVREAYRRNKHLLTDIVAQRTDEAVALAFIWMDNNLADSEKVEQCVVSLLRRMAERLQKTSHDE